MKERAWADEHPDFQRRIDKLVTAMFPERNPDSIIFKADLPR